MAGGIINLPKNNEKDPSRDEMMKRPWCHRIYVPVVYAEAVMGPNNQPVGQQMRTDLTLTKCLGAQCAIWDEELKACCDKVGTKAERERAGALKEIAKHYDAKSKEPTFLDVGG